MSNKIFQNMHNIYLNMDSEMHVSVSVILLSCLFEAGVCPHSVHVCVNATCGQARFN